MTRIRMDSASTLADDFAVVLRPGPKPAGHMSPVKAWFTPISEDTVI
jgi:hypothetical protein